MTGLLFAVLCAASLVLLYRLFKSPESAYTPVEVRDRGIPFDAREPEDKDDKGASDIDAKPLSSLEFIPKRQVPLSGPYQEPQEPEPPPKAAPPPPFVPAPPPQPPQRPRPAFQVYKPALKPTPESKSGAAASSAAFLAAPKPAAKAAEPSPAPAPRPSAPASKPASKERSFTPVVR